MTLTKAQLEALLRAQLDTKYGAKQDAVRTQYDNQLAALAGEGASADADYARSQAAAQTRRQAELKTLLSAYEQDALRRGMSRSTYALDRADQGRATLAAALEGTLADAALQRDTRKQTAQDKATGYAFARDNALSALSAQRADEQASRLMELLLELQAQAEPARRSSGGTKTVQVLTSAPLPTATARSAGGGYKLVR